MPETFTTTIKASQLRAGDIVVGAYGRTAVISGHPRVGRLYVTTRTSDQGGEVRWELEDDVEVQRQRPTTEERAEAELRMTIETLDWSEQFDQRRYVDLQAAVIEDVRKYGVPTWDNLEALPKAKVRADLWIRVARTHLHMVMTFDGTEAPGRLDALRVVQERTLEDVIRQAGYVVGRSSSEATNLLERMAHSGMADWAREVRDLLERLA